MRKRLPNRRAAPLFDIIVEDKSGNKYPVVLQTGEYKDGLVGEIFITVGNGGFVREVFNAIALSVSIGLQHGISLKQFKHTFRLVNIEPDVMTPIFESLERTYPDQFL